MWYSSETPTPCRSSVNLSSDATSITSSSSISSSVEETLGGVEPSDFETEDQKDIALDLASAVWMVVSVFQCVANTLYSDKLLVLVSFCFSELSILW